MNIASIISGYLHTTLCSCILFFSIGQFFPTRLNSWKLILLSAAFSLGTIPKLIFGLVSHITLMINLAGLVCLISVPFWLYKGTLWKKLVTSFYFFMLQFMSDALASSFFLQADYTTDSPFLTPEVYFRYIIISTIIWASSAFISILILRMISIKKFKPFYLLFFLYPSSLLLLVLGFTYRLESWSWTAGALLGLTAEFALLFYTIRQEQKAELEAELEAVRHTLELEQAHYEMVEERREELAKIRHDFNNHLAAISRLVRSGQKNDAQELIRRLTLDIEQTRERPYCSIPVVNAILTEKEKDCSAAGIRLETDLFLPSGSSIEPLHLCSIFGNLMDNAIRGCKESGSTDPVIRLASRIDGDYLFLKAENPSASPENARRPGHGYRTRILAGLAKEYGGDYSGSYENGTYTAIVTLITHPR